MLTINLDKIKENYDKINKINKINNCDFLDNYLQKYIEFIGIEKILKNYKIINQSENVDPYQFINKKYLLNEKILLGAGAYGTVYKLLNNMVVKIENVYSSLSSIKNKFNEIKISKIAGKYKIGPKVYKNEIFYNIFDSQIYFLTYIEYIEGVTFAKYNNDKKESPENINKITKIINKKKNLLHKLGFIHYDFHKGNIMIKIKDNKIIDVYIIDFGLSKKINNMNAINNYDYNILKEKLNYFIQKKYIKISCNSKISNKINEIYNIVLANKNIGIIRSESSAHLHTNNFSRDLQYITPDSSKQINNIYNINLLSTEIINKFINNKNTIKVNEINKNEIYKEEDLVNKKYTIDDEIMNNDIKNYNFFEWYDDIFKMYYCKDINNNKYLCIIYKIYDDLHIEERIKYSFNISKILYKNKLGLNFTEYNFIIYKNDLFLSYYIKLEKKSLTHNFSSVKNISLNIIQKYFESFVKKLIDLKIYFKYFNIENIKSNLFLYNNNIYYFNILKLFKIKDLMKKKYDNIYIDKLNNNQKIEFINQLIKNKLITIK